jgi:hypothetical protein
VVFRHKKTAITSGSLKDAPKNILTPTQLLSFEESLYENKVLLVIICSIFILKLHFP